ncbi:MULTISPECIES: GNAT family N-acetyltransferase [unclassified Pseudomonas]|uniref:GNAT family N-acetyltransferase n=1 Tax=unclassified Pseudomonas TaxID=196821 RepID=UPI001474D2B5|nr:GNAT family N-acetyltransferase [Pseudomonas sp. WS 5078]NMY59306.1 GNAT family N-acetyltransferase [Pseudomonas sp. WS 5354]
MSAACLLLRKDLRGPLPPARPWPEGFTVSTLSASLTQPVHALLVEGYAAGQGSVPSFAAWQHTLAHDAEYDPALCFVLLHATRVVGVALAWTSAYLKDLVIDPAYQGRGLGSALLEHVFAIFRQRGEPCVDLKVMAHNLKARDMYARHGMALVQYETV